MTYEELYSQAMNGNKRAIKELNDYAGAGDAEAQYVLSCIYDNVDSPFRDERLGMYWLQKSAGYKYEPAIKKLKEMSLEMKKRYKIEVSNKDIEGHVDTNSSENESGVFLSFRGRIDRKTYIVYLIVFALIFRGSMILINQIPLEDAAGMRLLFSLFVLCFTLDLSAKRLHDCGHSGWWVILALITAPIGPLYLLFKKGEENTNEYGPAID